MRRLVWVAIGAAGGIYAYRTVQRLRDDARERGIVVTAQEAGTSALAAAQQARDLVGRLVAAREDTDAPRDLGSGAAAARVLSQAGGR